MFGLIFPDVIPHDLSLRIFFFLCVSRRKQNPASSIVCVLGINSIGHGSFGLISFAVVFMNYFT